MCGIAGWIGKEPEEPRRLAAALCRILHHRGPDGEGFREGSGWGFAFRRLAVIDPTPSGDQPMCTPDGRFWIVFNGEIFNYLELRDELERRGERFRGGSDTEVLLRLLAAEGPAALGKLNGMFALALVDIQARRFLLARDRFGVKPLHYRITPGELRFASELKALLAWPDASKHVDPAAVAEYLALGYVPGARCVYAGYSKLAPAHYLAGSVDEPESAREVRYWRLEINDSTDTGPLSTTQQDELRWLLADAVRVRLRSDVPVGIFLSGGLDSGLVAAFAARNATRKPVAVTVGFSDGDADETRAASIAAAHLGLEHHIVIRTTPSLADLDRLAHVYDEPFADSSALPMLALCEAARGLATVFLSGDGGDEAFAGYRRYLAVHRYRWLSNLPEAARYVARLVAHRLPPESHVRSQLDRIALPEVRLAAAFDLSPEDAALREVLSPELQQLSGAEPLWKAWSAAPGAHLLARQQALDYGLYLPDDILVKVDRASMANSLEVRSPFLDYRLVEWTARLPRGVLLTSSAGKLPLRSIARELLPSAAHGVKRGFGAPVDAWFRQPAGRKLVEDRLLSRESACRRLWRPAAVTQMLKAQSAGTRDLGFLFWRLLVLEGWARSHDVTFDFGTAASGRP